MTLSDLESLANKTSSGCWLWPRGCSGSGYGQFRLDGQHHYVHRLAYTLGVGLIPPGWPVDHLCNNPTCFNPEHLEAVTRSENERRKFKRNPELGRKRSKRLQGNQHAKDTKLTTTQLAARSQPSQCPSCGYWYKPNGMGRHIRNGTCLRNQNDIT